MSKKIITKDLEREFQLGTSKFIQGQAPTIGGIPKSASMLSNYFTTPDGNGSQLTVSEQRTAQKQSYGDSVKRVSGDGFKVLANNLAHFDPEIRNPLTQSDNFFIPQQTVRTGAPNVELNRWLSYYYKGHPLIGNLVDLHSELPLSRFGFQGIEDSWILDFYEEVSDDLDLFNVMSSLLKTWFLYGEACPYLFWDDDLNRFDQVTFLDNSYVEVFTHTFFHNVEGNPTALYSLIPDELLSDLVRSNHPRIRELVYNNLPDAIVQAVNENKPLIMHNFNTEVIMRKANPWEVRGTSIVYGCLKELMQEDKLREAQFGIAEGHVTPTYIWKLGQPGEYMPTTQDLQDFREVLISLNNDPIKHLITHYAVNLQVEGSSGRLLPIIPELQFIEERIMMRMFSNRALLTSSGVTFSNASVALRTMMSRYIPIRAMAENFIIRKVFIPVALANGFMKRKKADVAHRVRTSAEELVLPIFNWSHKQNLLDDSNIKSMLLQLRAAGDLPMSVICKALDLDYAEVKSFLAKEQGTVLDVAARKKRDADLQAIQKEEGETSKSHWMNMWKRFRDMILPPDRDNLDKVVKRMPEETNGKMEPESQQETPAPPGAPGVEGAPSVPETIETPEEAATPPEPNTEAPLGANKLGKEMGVPVFNRNASMKETTKYFDMDNPINKEGREAYKLNTGKLEQFDFLRTATSKIDREGVIAKKVYCVNCDWAQTKFLPEKTAALVKEEKWEELELGEDDLKDFQAIVSSFHWLTLADYESDKKKVCPKCKERNVIEIEKET